MRRLARNPEVVIVQNPAPGSFRRNGMKRRRKSRKNRGHGRRRSTRRNGTFKAFQRKHRSVYKRLGFKAGSRKVASMWRKKR